jgi:hypothetical protein
MKNIFNGANEIHFDTRSVGKSFTSTLLGIAIRDRIHKSETQIMKILQPKIFQNYSASKIVLL